MSFIETSAKTNANVESLFESITKSILCSQVINGDKKKINLLK
jgi:hypothetical protein